MTEQEKTPEPTITLKRSHVNIAIVAVIFLAAGWFLGTNQLGGGNATGNAAGTGTGTGTSTTGGGVSLSLASLDYSGIEKGTLEGAPALGRADAPILMFEYSDLQCPFCDKFHEQTLQQILSNYVKTGKVRFVYKNFPLSFHPQAPKSAEAALCAQDQGKFWEYHDAVFANQDKMQASTSEWNGILKQLAAQLGLNTATFSACLDSGSKQAQVESESGEGTTRATTASHYWTSETGTDLTLLTGGASETDIGTPFFIINGKTLVGAYPYAAFREAFEYELNQTR